MSVNKMDGSWPCRSIREMKGTLEMGWKTSSAHDALWKGATWNMKQHCNMELNSCMEFFLHLHQIFSNFFSFQIMFFVITGKYISFQNVSFKGNYASGHYLLKLEGCLMANLPIHNRIFSPDIIKYWDVF